jgi:hypothetical protein
MDTPRKRLPFIADNQGARNSHIHPKRKDDLIQVAHKPEQAFCRNPPDAAL